MRKTQLSVSVYYACLLIGQQWRIDNDCLKGVPRDPKYLKAEGTHTGHTASAEPATANEPREA